MPEEITKNQEKQWLEGQLMWWDHWQKAKIIQKQIADAEHEKELQVADEILKQLERRLKFLGE